MRRLIGLALLVAAAAAAQNSGVQVSPAAAAKFNAQLAVAYLKQNDIGAAQEKIDKALAENPKDAAVQTAAGLVYERLQDTAKADRYYSAALRIEPGNPDMQNNYAVFECRRGHWGAGQKLFEQAARNPAYSTPEVAYANAGVCARSAGDLPRAEQYFRDSLAKRTDFPDALLQLADVTFARGNGLAARGFLQRFFHVASPTADALLLGVRIERKLDDAAESQRYAQQLQQQFPESEQARQLRSGAVGE